MTVVAGHRKLYANGRLAWRISLNAKIFLDDDDQLVAELANGVLFSHVDAVCLADWLWNQGVTVSEVLLIDWHEDAERAPLSGQKIALFQRLRLHERSKD